MLGLQNEKHHKAHRFIVIEVIIFLVADWELIKKNRPVADKPIICPMAQG